MSTNDRNEDWRQIRQQRMFQLYGQPQSQSSNDLNNDQRSGDLVGNHATISMNDIRKEVKEIEKTETKLKVEDYTANSKKWFGSLKQAIRSNDLEKVKQITGSFPDNLAVVNFVNNIKRIKNNGELSNKRVEGIIKKHQDDMLKNPDVASMVTFINMQDERGNTLMTFLNEESIRKIDLSIIEHLIECGVDINKLNKDQNNLLRLAVIYDCPGIVELLVEHNAKVNIMDWGGRTPLDLARMYGRCEIVQYLKSHGAVSYQTNR